MERDAWGNPIDPAPAPAGRTSGLRKLAGLAILAVGLMAGCLGLIGAQRSQVGTVVALIGVGLAVVGLLLTWSAEHSD